MIGALLPAAVAVAAMAYGLMHYSVWSFGIPGSGLMPLAGGAIVLVSCLAIAISERHAPPAVVLRKTPLAYAAAFLVLLPLTAVIGLLPALAILSVVILGAVERMPLGRAVLVAAVVSGGSWLLFSRLLLVPLPQGWIWSL